MNKAKTEQILYVFASILTTSQRKIRITKSGSDLNALAKENRIITRGADAKSAESGYGYP